VPGCEAVPWFLLLVWLARKRATRWALRSSRGWDDSLPRQRRRRELGFRLLAEGCPARNRAPDWAPARQHQHRRPRAPERRHRPVPQDLEEAPDSERRQITAPVTAEADLLDQERAGSLELADQDRDHEERGGVEPRDLVEDEKHAEDRVAGH